MRCDADGGSPALCRRSGIIIAVATNSATDPNTNDDLQATAIAV
jgi:hypothetical protein